MSKHTPIPWRPEEQDHQQIKNRFGWRVLSKKNDTVAYVQYEDDVPLIAAAPEMLEALIAVYDADACSVDCDRDDGVWPMVGAIIAKAKGEQT